MPEYVDTQPQPNLFEAFTKQHPKAAQALGNAVLEKTAIAPAVAVAIPWIWKALMAASMGVSAVNAGKRTGKAVSAFGAGNKALAGKHLLGAAGEGLWGAAALVPGGRALRGGSRLLRMGRAGKVFPAVTKYKPARWTARMAARARGRVAPDRAVGLSAQKRLANQLLRTKGFQSFASRGRSVRGVNDLRQLPGARLGARMERAGKPFNKGRTMLASMAATSFAPPMGGAARSTPKARPPYKGPVFSSDFRRGGRFHGLDKVPVRRASQTPFAGMPGF